MKVKELHDTLEFLDGEMIVWVTTDGDEQHVRIVTSDPRNLHICAGYEAKLYPCETMEWQAEE